MKRLEWSQAIALGIKEIDDEHKKLITHVNATIDAVSKKRGRSAIMKEMKALREYTVYHFNNEERFMKSHNYSGYDAHCQEHDALKKQVKDFQHQLYIEEQLTPEEVTLFFKHWLIDHVIRCDMKLKEFVPPEGENPTQVYLSPIEWSDKYSIHVEQIDEEHKIIFELLNSAIEQANEGSCSFADPMQALKSHAFQHFESEETFMEIMQYPGIESQKKEHKELLSKLDTLLAEINAKTCTPENALIFFKDWIVHHILQHDMNIRKHLKSLEQDLA
ncbi:MAG: bacteriohemerythrin [Desulfovibrio sp.]